MKKHVLAMLTVAALAATCGAQAAWPFGGKKKADEKKPEAVVMPPEAGKPVAQEAAPAADASRGQDVARRVHLRFETEQAELEFLTLAEARRRVQEDLRVLRRIVQEKQLESARFQQQLKDEFGIDPEADYQFEDETSTLYLLTRKDGAETNAAADVQTLFDRAEHMKLDDPERRKLFLRIVATKQLAGEELNVLGLLVNEKEIEADTVHEQMVAKYAITNDREYRYDRSRKILFELVPVPAGTSTTDSAGEAATR
jgi:hypothetical protein